MATPNLLRGRHVVHVTVLWILVLAFPSSCAGLSIVSDIITKCEGATGPQDGCSIAGDGDFYGVGVRYGIYLSWFASWFGNNFLRREDEICQSLDTNTIFLTAIAIVTAWYSVSSNIRVIDALILLQLCFGYLLSVMSLWGYRTRIYGDNQPRNRAHFGGWGTHFRLALMAAICAYGIWFWSWGLPVYLPRCNMRQQCGGLKLWIVVERRVTDVGIQYLFLAFSSICGAFYFSMILVASMATLKLLWKMLFTSKRKGRDRFRWRLREKIEKAEPWPLNLPIWLRYPVMLLNLLWLVFSVVSIEKTISLNHVTGLRVERLILSAGQFIPLITGACNLARVVWKWLMQIIFADKIESRVAATTTLTTTEVVTGAGAVASSSYCSTCIVNEDRRWLWKMTTTLWPWLCVFKFWRHAGRKRGRRPAVTRSEKRTGQRNHSSSGESQNEDGHHGWGYER